MTDAMVLRDASEQPSRTWPNSYGTYLAGRSHIDAADAIAADMEAKWGAGRLRLLVAPELRERFDRQRYLLNQAIWHGRDVEAVRREAVRMVKAWQALDQAATSAGHARLDPMVWEVVLPDGMVCAIVPSDAHASLVKADGRKVAVYTLEEIARLLSHDRSLVLAKLTFPGATVAAVRKMPIDPLEAFSGSASDLDRPLANEALPF
jgi:hypothetical protein